MTIDCEQCLRLVSRQIDQATSNKETQEARAHALQCADCRSKFTVIMGADTLLGKALLSARVSDGFSAMVAERLAQAHMAEAAAGPPKLVVGAAVALAALILLLLISILSASGPQIPSIGEVGRVEEVEKKLELAMFESDSFYGVSAGTEIPRGAKARTTTGVGLLRLSGGRSVALAPGTVLDLAHYHDGSKVLLEDGGAYVYVPGTDMQVDTPGAKVYANKASFLVRYDSSGKTTVVVRSGRVSLFNESGAVTVESGQKCETSGDGAPESPSKTDVERYTDWVHQLGL